jgi:hypothetical protein
VADYGTLSGKNRHKVDLCIAVDIATSGLGQSPFNFDRLKDLPPQEYLQGIRDHYAEHVLDVNEQELRQAANRCGLDTRNPTDSFPEELKLAARQLAGRDR